ncbi:uncharacterized protein LOC112048803 [Bicyclus anynana]|uniref:Uncharacterized protein LOC112048803 n=1 Tax=Bicyclus anynana TaxID=110368 RepID=A0ABM3M3P0_BICAN|nr:uncharacterized protein LOC112048803 [Bicyclus anynana]
MVLLNSKCFYWAIYVKVVMSMDTLLEDLLTPIPQLGEKCGYDSCPNLKTDWINVHLVPHSHGELGLAKTFTEYYTGDSSGGGMRMRINWKNILDSSISELWADKGRRFTISNSELPYFFHWWKNRDGTIHRMVYELVRQGRLVFVGGGWGMPDEACTSYQAIIDSYTYSLRKLNATFLSCARPLVAWQADSFGHSRELTSLVAQMGFDGLFVNPISFDDELLRMQRRALEFVWRGSDDLGGDTDIYTHKLFDGYWSPPGYCFGSTCDDPLFMASDAVFNNVEQRIEDFITKIRYRQAPHYNTRHVMVMMGKRLGFYDAKLWFTNIDKLIHNLNERTYKNNEKMHAFYSTPACYLKAVYDENPPLETKQDDFFPYAYNKDTYATGMYTTRPTFKYLVRESNIFLQIAKQLQVLTNLDNNDKLFEDFNWIMGVVQDHNIISGAMRDHVANYYTEKLHSAVQWSTELIQTAFNKIRNSPPHTEYMLCYLNISSCPDTKITKFHITVYNPLAWPVTMPVRLPIRDIKYVVFDPSGAKIQAAKMKIPNHIFDIPNRIDPATHELVFIAQNIPPLGLRSYYIENQTLKHLKKILKRKTRKMGRKPLEAQKITRVKKSLKRKIRNIQGKSNIRQNLIETPKANDYIDFDFNKLDTIDKLDDLKDYETVTSNFRREYDDTQINDEISINNETLVRRFDDFKIINDLNKYDKSETVTMSAHDFEETQFDNDEWPTKNVDDPNTTTDSNVDSNDGTITLKYRNDFDEIENTNNELSGNIDDDDFKITTDIISNYDNTILKYTNKFDEKNLDNFKITTEYDSTAFKNYDEEESLYYNTSEISTHKIEVTTKGLIYPVTRTESGVANNDIEITSIDKVEVTTEGLNNAVTRTKSGVINHNDIEITSVHNKEELYTTTLSYVNAVTRTEGWNVVNTTSDVEITSKRNIEVTSEGLINAVIGTDVVDIFNNNSSIVTKSKYNIEGTSEVLPDTNITTIEKEKNNTNRKFNEHNRDLIMANNNSNIVTSKYNIEVTSEDLQDTNTTTNEKEKHKKSNEQNRDILNISAQTTEENKSLSIARELNVLRSNDSEKYNLTNNEENCDDDLDADYSAVDSKDKIIRNQHVQINIDGYNKISSMNLSNGVNTSLDIQFYYYVSDEPVGNSTKKQPGAYIFRSANVYPEPIIDFVETKVYKTDIVQEIHIKYSKYASFVVKLYKNQPIIEIDWVIGPIPVEDNRGKEVFIRYTTDLENEGTFYTDANGRQMMKRIRHMRATYEPYNLDPIAGNFYPVTSRIYIEDIKKNLRLSIFNDRAQGGSSLLEGSIDLMVLRRILTDDTGSFIFANETEHNKGLIVRGTHYLYLTKANSKQNRVYEKKLAKEIELKPQILFNRVKQCINRRYWNSYKNEYTFINKKLPIGIHILTIQKWDGETMLLRLENYLEQVDIVKNGVKKINLTDLFVNIKPLSLVEMTLSANMLLKDKVKYNWRINGSFVKNFNEFYGFKDKVDYSKDEFELPNDVNIQQITLVPQQIRTFVIKYEYKRLLPPGGPVIDLHRKLSTLHVREEEDLLRSPPPQSTGCDEGGFTTVRSKRSIKRERAKLKRQNATSGSRPIFQQPAGETSSAAGGSGVTRPPKVKHQGTDPEEQRPAKRRPPRSQEGPRKTARELSELAVAFHRADGVLVDAELAKEIRKRLSDLIGEAIEQDVDSDKLNFVASGLVSEGFYLVTPANGMARDWLLSCNLGLYDGVPIRSVRRDRAKAVIWIPGMENRLSCPLNRLKGQNKTRTDLQIPEWNLIVREPLTLGERLIVGVPQEVCKVFDKGEVWLYYELIKVQVRLLKGKKVGTTDVEMEDTSQRPPTGATGGSSGPATSYTDYQSSGGASGDNSTPPQCPPSAGASGTAGLLRAETGTQKSRHMCGDEKLAGPLKESR